MEEEEDEKEKKNGGGEVGGAAESENRVLHRLQFPSPHDCRCIATRPRADPTARRRPLPISLVHPVHPPAIRPLVCHPADAGQLELIRNAVNETGSDGPSRSTYDHPMVRLAP